MKPKYLLHLSFILFMEIAVAIPDAYAQEETMEFHGMEPEEDVFQDAFFAALRYKAIGSYKLALEALDNADREAGTQKERRYAVNFERAQNHYYLKQYQESIAYLEELSKATKKREVLSWLYLVYMDSRAFYEAKKAIVDLLEYSEVYLPSFYMLYVDLKDQPEEALEVLEKVFSTKTNTREVEFYKDLIQESLTGKVKSSKNQKDNLSEKETLKLQTYLQNKEWEEAELYMELLLQDATYVVSVWKALEELKDKDQAIRSIIFLFKKKSIPDVSKRALLNNLIEDVANTNILLSLVPEIYKYLDALSLKSFGDYHIQHSDKEQAIQLYLMSLAISFDNYSLIVETLQLLSDTKEYEEQLKLSETAIEYYPVQPVLYLHRGEALLGMQLWEHAKNVLEEGASYIIDFPRLEEEFKDKIQEANNNLN